MKLSQQERRTEPLENLHNRWQMLREKHQNIREDNIALQNHVQKLEEVNKILKTQSYDAKVISRAGTRSIIDGIKRDRGPIEKQVNHFKEKLAFLQQSTVTSNQQAEQTLTQIQVLLDELDETIAEETLLCETFPESDGVPNPITTVAVSLLGTTLINENSPGLKSLQKELKQIDMYRAV